MITGRDFIVLSDDWDGLPTSTIHLFRLLARRNRVFWLNTINRMPRLAYGDAKKALNVLGKWCGQWFAPSRRPEALRRDGLGRPHVVNPLMIPWFKPPIRRLNRLSLLRTYRCLSRRHGIRDPIVITTFPSTVDFIASVAAEAKIYYCVDEWSELPGVCAADWTPMEDELLGRVDGLVATSRNLLRKCRPSCSRLYLPHGVDFEHFSRSPAETLGTELDGLPRPIVGFFGLIHRWVDLRLIEMLGRTFPDVSFVLLGKSEVDMAAVSACPNIHWLGPVPYGELPRYASRFDVGLIPFVRNKLTEAVNPLKLLEYYALGLPVLATRLPELEHVGGPIRLAETDREFCSLLRATLDDLPHHAPEEAVAVARENTWQRRVEQLSDFLDGLLGNESPRQRELVEVS